MSVRAAKLSATVTLAVACRSQGPKIDPERMRSQPAKSAPTKTIGKIGHISGITARIKR